MSLKRPLDGALSPVANWLTVVALLLPVGLCMAYLELSQLRSGGAALTVVVTVAVSAVSAVYWKRLRLIRYLPIAYGIAFCIGVQLMRQGFDWRGVFEALALGVLFGLVLMFSIRIDEWNEQ